MTNLLFIILPIILVVFVLAIALFIFVLIRLLNEIDKNDFKPILHLKTNDEIKHAGDLGELNVSYQLRMLLNRYKGYLFDNYIFEDDKGFSSEIDHILITQGGIFIIETKANKGTIIEDYNDNQWISIKKSYQDNKEFNNPLIQNQRHINHLKRMFKNPPKMISIIIFTEADLSNVKADNVFDVKDAINKIEALTLKQTYSIEFVETNYKQLQRIKDIHGITKEKHLANIKKYNNC